VRAHRRPVVTGAEALIGAVGQARTDLAPLGQIQLHGEIWEARAEAPVGRGEWVEVTGRDGLTLMVRRQRAVPSQGG
jgi:membrane-bound serine protease (ClpP class)